MERFLRRRNALVGGCHRSRCRFIHHLVHCLLVVKWTVLISVAIEALRISKPADVVDEIVFSKFLRAAKIKCVVCSVQVNASYEVRKS